MDRDINSTKPFCLKAYNYLVFDICIVFSSVNLEGGVGDEKGMRRWLPCKYVPAVLFCGVLSVSKFRGDGGGGSFYSHTLVVIFRNSSLVPVFLEGRFLLIEKVYLNFQFPSSKVIIISFLPPQL